MALPKRATAYDFATMLVDQSDTRLFKNNPTIAAGDFQRSIDYAAFANLTTLPTVTPSSTRQLKISLSGTEMTADNLGIQGVDAAGAEWCDVFFDFSLGTVTADDLNTNDTNILAQVSNIAVTSAALNAVAASETLTTGTDAGGVANTATLDGVFDTWTAAGNAIDGYYEFDLSVTTGAVGVGVTWDGYLSGVVNTIKVYAYNWAGTAWDQIGTITGIAGTVVAQDEYELTSAHTGTGGNAGKVRIRFAQTGLTTGVLKTDRILLGYAVVLTPPVGWSSQIIGSDGGVVLAQFLADGTTPAAHGGPVGTSVATIACSRFVGVSQTTDTACWSMTGNGTGAGSQSIGGASNGDGCQNIGGGTAGNGLVNAGGGNQAAVAGYGSGLIGISTGTGTGGDGATFEGAGTLGVGATYVSDTGSNLHLGGVDGAISGNTVNTDCVVLNADGAGKHSIVLSGSSGGSGDILGNLAGYIKGAASPTFAGVGVQADVQSLGGQAIPQGTVDTSTLAATTTAFETSFVTNFDQFTDQAIYFVAGALGKITRRVSAYQYTGNNKVKLTLGEALPAAPLNGQAFIIFGAKMT